MMATIALEMIPASDKENVQGTILINPGGPGASGTDGLRRWGKYVAEIVGGTYNILSFDPRGVGESTPLARCFQTEFQRQVFELRSRRRLLNRMDDSVVENLGWERLVAEQCLKTLGQTSPENSSDRSLASGRFMSSASVATDMLSIIDKLGQDKLHYWGYVCCYFANRAGSDVCHTELWVSAGSILRCHVSPESGQNRTRRSM